MTVFNYKICLLIEATQVTDNVPAIVRYDGDDGVQERFEHGRHVLLQPVALFGCESALPHKTKLKERRSFCCSRLKERRNSSPISPFPRKRRFSGERNFDTLTPLRSQPQKKRRITANILTFGRDKRCGKRGFGSRTVFSIQLFVETKLFTFASRLNSRKSLRNFVRRRAVPASLEKSFHN